MALEPREQVAVDDERIRALDEVRCQILRERNLIELSDVRLNKLMRADACSFLHYGINVKTGVASYQCTYEQPMEGTFDCGKNGWCPHET